MLGTYRAVFRAPGSAAFVLAGFVARMPLALYPIALVLIISGRTGHYGFAGIASALYIAGTIPGAPILSRLVDRLGQRRVLLPSLAVHLAAVVVLAVLLEAGAPDAAIIAPVVVAGFAYISVGSLVRARWSLVLEGRPELATAYSLESILDELIFTVGPLIATVIASFVDPVITLYVALALVGAGGVWLSSQRGTEPPVHKSDGGPRASALRVPGVPLVIVATVFVGGVFASAEVTMVAFCGQHGHRHLSGLVVALFAAGSGCAGFFYGARPWRATVLSRYRIQAAVFAVLPVLFVIPTDVAVLAVVSFLVGLGTAPALITTFALVQQLVPGAALTEGLTWVQTGLSVGYGIGAAVVGGIADAHGARTAFLVTIGSGLLVGVAAQIAHRAVRASRTGSQTSVAPSEHAALP